MSIILFVLFGVVVGVLARLVLPGRQHISMLMTVVLGVVGSLVGGLVATALGTGEYNELDFLGTVVAIATALGADGWRLALADRNRTGLEAILDRLPEAVRDRASIHPLDVTDDASCTDVVTETTRVHGGLSLLVNGAGVMVRRTALETDVETLQSVLDVNLTGAFRMAKAAYPALSKEPGSIVSISSTHAFLAAKNSFAYGVSKAGLSHLTRLLALEWAEAGIRVNAVAPTVVPSAMTAGVLADPEYVTRKMGAIPLHAPIATAHVASAVAYLASPAAASTTGQVLVLDGGESLA